MAEGISVKIDREQYAAIQQVKGQTDVPIACIVRRAIAAWLVNERKKQLTEGRS